MPTLSLHIRILACLLAAFGLGATARADAPYWVMFRDGEQLRGQVMHHWHGGKLTKLDDQVLFDRENPPRVIRRTGATVRADGPYVEFTNGDQLQGRVTSFRKAAALDQPDSLIVAVGSESTILPVSSGEVRVRAEMVRVMLWDARRRLAHYQPGAVLFRDGRRAHCRSVRMTESGLRLLTSEGLVEASFSELSELHLPDREWDVAENQLRFLQWAEENMLLESLIFTDGARLTFPQGMTEMETHYRSERFAYCAVHPRWTLDPLYFDPEQAALSVYRRLNEVPVSLLPTTVVRQQGTFHTWPWQRDRSVQGELLSSGDLTLCEGFGVHGDTTLAIHLPRRAVSFSGWVGIDRAAGQRGAMTCKVIGQKPEGQLLWESGMLRGGEAPRVIGPLDVSGLEQLLLTAEEEVKDPKPADLDPFDIGDDLCWLLTTVTLSNQLIEGEPIDRSLARWIPELAGWHVKEDSAEVQLRPIWNEKEERWRFSVGLRDPDGGNSRILLTRRVKVSLANAYVSLSAASHVMHAGHELSLWVGSERVGSTMNADPKTGRQVGRFDSRVYVLADYVGQEIDLTLRIEPSDPRPPGSGVFFEAAELRPLVLGLPADGKALVPEVLLDELKPNASTLDAQAWQPRTDGMVSDRRPLNIQGYPLSRGIGAPAGSEITYELQPQWKRFVAIVGLASGWQGAGPFEVLIDGRQTWISTDPDVFHRNSTGQQVSLPIPPGSKTITLKTSGTSSTGVWGEAGFLSE